MSPPAAGPLAGLRVVDLGLSWAAPFAGMMLADMGADVIRVESHHHLDILRWSAAFVDNVRDFEHSGYYLACNRGKRSVALNLKKPEGRDLLLDLVEGADVLLENFAPKVMASLGLAADVLHTRNPRLVILSMSGYGADGPDAERSAYGDHLMHASGMCSLIGEPEDPHTRIGTFYGDPVGGLYGALGILVALDRVRATGKGEHLDYSQVEGLVSLMPTAFMAASGGSPLGRSADKSPAAVPHGFYRCRGDDRWVALAVRSDSEWARFAPLVGFDAARTTSLPERRASEASIDGAVASWTASLSPWQVTHACQALGIAAYPVMSSQDLLLDDHLAERNFFRRVHRSVTGPDLIPGVTFRIASGEGDEVAVRGPAPLLGEHTEEVLRDILGLSPERIEALTEAGVLD